MKTMPLIYKLASAAVLLGTTIFFLTAPNAADRTSTSIDSTFRGGVCVPQNLGVTPQGFQGPYGCDDKRTVFATVTDMYAKHYHVVFAVQYPPSGNPASGMGPVAVIVEKDK